MIICINVNLNIIFLKLTDNFLNDKSMYFY